MQFWDKGKWQALKTLKTLPYYTQPDGKLLFAKQRRYR